MGGSIRLERFTGEDAQVMLNGKLGVMRVGTCDRVRAHKALFIFFSLDIVSHIVTLVL